MIAVAQSILASPARSIFTLAPLTNDLIVIGLAKYPIHVGTCDAIVAVVAVGARKSGAFHHGGMLPCRSANRHA